MLFLIISSISESFLVVTCKYVHKTNFTSFSISLSRGISHSKAEGSPVSELPRAFQSLPPEMGEHGAAGCARLAWGPGGLRGKALKVEGCPEVPPEGHCMTGDMP